MRRLLKSPAPRLVVLILALVHVGLNSASGDDNAEKIVAWIEQLNADRFITRELATERLLALGQAAIDPLSDKLINTSRETLSRGAYILRKLALSDDPDVSEKAEAGLRSLAASNDAQTVRQANLALDRLSESRRDHALAELRRLGAVIETQHVQIGRAIVPNLLTLELSEQWKGKPDDLRRVRWLTDINNVTLSGENINDECVENLRRLPSLSIVRLKKCKVTDQAAEHLANHKQLQHLAILYCPISDKSVDQLKVHQRVALLKLYGTGITPAGAERLRKEMNATEVDYRQGAFLGIACDPNAAECVITYCQPGGAAEKGGLEAGDLILKYNGKPATNFASLTKLIAENRPGDKAKIELMREGKTLTKEIELGEWE